MDNDNIIIYDNDIESAQVLCSSISDTNKRNRAVANVLASEIASRFFNQEDYDIDTETGLHNVDKVLGDFDISDLYINGAYIDARVYFSEDELCVPKSHFDLGITPVVYMFIKLNQNLSGGIVTGFIRPQNIDKNNLKDDNYFISESDLCSFYDIESSLTKVLDVFEGSNEKIYDFLDGSLNENDKILLLKELIESKNARRALIKADRAQNVFNFVSTPNPDISEIVTPEVTAEATAEEDHLDDLFDAKDNNAPTSDEEELFNALEYSTEVTPSSAGVIETVDKESAQNEEQIDELFTGQQEGIPANKKKSSKGFLTLLLIIAIAAAGGAYWYSNSSVPPMDDETFARNTLPNLADKEVIESNKKVEDAMPNETVDTTPAELNNKEEGNSVAIPAIEQHLDASVLVSNLKVDWEVPAGYASNTAAKRYFVKLGKIIQLNLKTELLLLSKPPLSNKITVELTFNGNKGKFDIVGIQDSSGEKVVDDTILQTVKNALNLGISSNLESFGKIQGNPILIIHL